MVKANVEKELAAIAAEMEELGEMELEAEPGAQVFPGR